MNPSRLTLITLLLTLCMPGLANEQKRATANTNYEECAARVFATSDKLSDVFEQCESEMESFVAQHDEAFQEKIRHRTKAETQRELRSRKKEEEEEEEDRKKNSPDGE